MSVTNTLIRSLLRLSEPSFIQSITGRVSVNRKGTSRDELVQIVRKSVLDEYKSMLDSESYKGRIRTQMISRYSFDWLKAVKPTQVRAIAHEAKILQMIHDRNMIWRLSPGKTKPEKVKSYRRIIGRDPELKDIISGMLPEFVQRKRRRVITPEEQRAIEKGIDSRLEDKLQRYEHRLKRLKGLKSSLDIVNYLTPFYARDIAPTFNPAFFWLFKTITEWTTFKNAVRNMKINTESKGTIENIRSLMKDYQVTFIPNHISHTDHIPLSFAINRSGIPHPYIIAGENLYRGKSRLILPVLGTVKFRRDVLIDDKRYNVLKWFHNPLYNIVFRHLTWALWDLHDNPFLFYIEGTRSRDGTILPPKKGLLRNGFEYVKDKDRPLVGVEMTQGAFLDVNNDKDHERGTSPSVGAAGGIASLLYDFIRHQTALIGAGKLPPSRVGLGNIPTGYVPQDFFSRNGVAKMSQLGERCSDYEAIRKLFYNSIGDNGILDISTEYTDATGTYTIGPAMAISEARVLKEQGATTEKPRILCFYDCVKQAFVQMTSGSYHTVARFDAFDGAEKVGVTIAYVYHHPEGKESPSYDKPYNNGDIIRPGDLLPTADVLEHCYPIIKVLDGWKENLGGREWKKGDTLPQQAQDLVETIEHFTGATIISIGNSPARDGRVYIAKPGSDLVLNL